VQNSTLGQPFNGQPSFASDQPDTSIQFAVPWMERYPYFTQRQGAQNTVTYNFAGDAVNAPSIMTAVRDDYEIGYLIHPLLEEGSRREAKLRRQKALAPPPTSKGTVATKGNPKTSMGTFFGL